MTDVLLVAGAVLGAFLAGAATVVVVFAWLVFWAAVGHRHSTRIKEGP